VVGTNGTNGTNGTDGTDGTDGMDGSSLMTTTFAGTVSDGAGTVDGSFVVLGALGDDANALGALAAVDADASGDFSMQLINPVAPSSRLRLTASSESGDLVAFAVSDVQDVTPATTGVASIIEQIVTTAGDGVGLSDYSNMEIDDLTSAADTALTMAATDLGDLDAVVEQVRIDVGEAIADASGSDPVYGTGVMPAPAAPADAAGIVDAFDFDLVNDELWDIQSDGSISDGTDDSYDGMFDLNVNGASYPSALAANVVTEDGRELVFPDVEDLGVTGLTVSRKVYIPETGRFARFLEVLTNTTADAITVDVLIDGNLGSDSEEVFGPSNASWHTSVENGGGDDPALGFLYPGATVVLDGDDVDYTFASVTIAPGATVSIVHFGFQDFADYDMDSIAAEMDLVLTTFPDEYFAGLTAAEIASVLGYFNNATVSGPAGTVAPFAEVTLTNEELAAVVTTTAASDGSFSAALAAASGDTIRITTDLGRDETIMAP
ncbi:MAG: hypothetical protein ACI9KE_005827, partial [Polyangiales bacterium]